MSTSYTVPHDIPEIPAPCQFLDRVRQSTPEQRLWTEVLAGVAYDYRDRRYRPGALAWVLGSDRAPASFVWTCEALGLNPRTMRRRVLAVFTAVRLGKPLAVQRRARIRGTPLGSNHA